MKNVPLKLHKINETHSYLVISLALFVAVIEYIDFFRFVLLF
jgi:hypothetical protein